LIHNTEGITLPKLEIYEINQLGILTLIFDQEMVLYSAHFFNERVFEIFVGEISGGANLVQAWEVISFKA